jgi:NAD(P)H-hydrate repair Nnr-like enzyme with NAD(P)H-hydrate epimerase domain
VAMDTVRQKQALLVAKRICLACGAGRNGGAVFVSGSLVWVDINRFREAVRQSEFQRRVLLTL